MLVEINDITIAEEKITITALAIEDIIMADDLFEDFEPKQVQYEFDRKAKNGAAMKYLYKVCQSQNKCKSAKTMGEKLERLSGLILQLGDAFRVKEA